MTASPPLAGLRVIELARVLAGPWAGQVLADLGASVVKVESLAGDDTRRWGPPSIDNPDGASDAAYFHSTNRGKRSIALDLSRPEGQTIVRRLAAGADVLIENFKVGGLKKYGLDFDSIHRLNPRLVYCSITGFGQDGPYASRPGYDFVIQGMGGIMDLTGDASGEDDRKDERPLPPALTEDPLCDLRPLPPHGADDAPVRRRSSRPCTGPMIGVCAAPCQQRW